jgi:hypothetical protein
VVPGRRIIGTYGGLAGKYIVIYFTGACSMSMKAKRKKVIPKNQMLCKIYEQSLEINLLICNVFARNRLPSSTTEKLDMREVIL